MNPHSMQAASIPNPALQPFGVLVGSWATTGTHPLVPGTTLRGRATFEWLENGAFLLWRSEIDEPGFPAGLAIFGSDHDSAAYTMLYFDERGVSRKFEVTLQGHVWKMLRMAPGFSQRFTGIIAEDGRSVAATWELSRDDATWQNDLVQSYTRLE